jgi:hypothetical protein
MTTDKRILWEQGHWRCEYRAENATERASVRVFSGDTLLFVHRDRNPEELLRVAEEWSRLFASLWGEDNGPARLELPRDFEDRRTAHDERRRVPRGGRRATDWR